MIVFTYDKSIFASEDNQWGGIVDQIKKVVNSSSSKLVDRINKFASNMNGSMSVVIKTQQVLESRLNNTISQQSEVLNELKSLRALI